MEYEYELVLEHHGVKGMRWGVRRYQNKDGTLTPAGKYRYGTTQTEQLERRVNEERRKGDAARAKAYRYERDIMEGRKTQNDADDDAWSKSIRKSDTHYRKANELETRLRDASKKAVEEGNKRERANDYIQKEGAYKEYADMSARNIARFSKGKSAVSKFLTKTNTWALDHNSAKYKEYKTKTDELIRSMSPDITMVRMTEYGPMFVPK